MNVNPSNCYGDESSDIALGNGDQIRAIKAWMKKVQ